MIYIGYPTPVTKKILKSITSRSQLENIETLKMSQNINSPRAPSRPSARGEFHF